MPDFLPIVLFMAGVAVVTTAAVMLSRWLEKRRRAAIQLVADRLGLVYDPEINFGLASQYEFLNQIVGGSNRYGSHILRGTYQSHPVLIFELHYETYSKDSKGNRTTHHHYYSVFTTTLPRSFPELTIRPEGMFSKIAQAFGYADIDFESAEFSRSYCVRSKDKKFAYAVCHPLAMQFLLDTEAMDFEIEGTTLAIVTDGSISPDGIERPLSVLLEFRNLLPEYLLKENT